jgi:hypothetical protein
MIVLHRNERTLVVTGWPEWAFSIAALVMAGGFCTALVVVLIVVGISISPVAPLLLQAALVAGTVQAALGRRSS